MAMAGLTWLHLSDWHQKGMGFDREVVRDALLEDIKKRREIHPDLEKLDFIVFSGDLAFSGKKEEYHAAAEHFLAPVLEAAGLDNSRLFIVPGNHVPNNQHSCIHAYLLSIDPWCLGALVAKILIGLRARADSKPAPKILAILPISVAI